MSAIVFSFACMGTASHAQTDVASDKAALESLYDATDGSQWANSTNWKTAQPLSTWYGLTVDSDGRVTEVELQDNGLSGTVPAAVGNLDHLERLDLRDNDLSGGLPTELENLTSLEALLLKANWALEGSLPSGLSDLSNMSVLSIEDTELCAPRDAAFQAWLATVSFTGLTCSPTDQTVVDVAIFFTANILDRVYGIDHLKTNVDLEIATTNQAFADGGANLSVRLVALEEVAYTTVDLTTDTFRLRGKTDGYMDGVHAIRDRVAADLVFLLTSTRGGRAFLMTNVSRDFADNAFSTGSLTTLPHELGHLMGLHHDRYEACGTNGACAGAAFPYAYGYINREAFEAGATESARWRTIMSYADECSVNGIVCSYLLRYSNPDQTHLGDALGIAGLRPSGEVTGPSNAVRALNRTRETVAMFRGPDRSVYFDMASYTANEGGTAASVTVRLSDKPERAISIPLVASATAGATVLDFDAPARLDFGANQTSATFSVTAVDDTADDDGESVELSFGSPLPSGISVGNPATTAIALEDDDAAVTGAPSIVNVALISDPGVEYAEGEEIVAALQFSKAVSVTGTPGLQLVVGSNTRDMTYKGVTGEVLTFGYTVALDESDAGGVSIGENSLTLSGATIQDSSNQAASLDHDALADDADHPVDAIKPSISDATVISDTMTLTFNDTLDENHVPPLDAFTVQVDSVEREVKGRYVGGSDVTLTVIPAVVYGESGITVSYAPGDPPIRDDAGNSGSAFSRSVTNDTPLPVYDSDLDGLINISNLAQLNAIRYDPDGNGRPFTADAQAYAMAFPDAGSRLRCGKSECEGYELTGDLDFDTNSNDRADSGDAYWNGSFGWDPIGDVGRSFSAEFSGNGHAIRNLYINRQAENDVGLFGAAQLSTMREIRLVDLTVKGNTDVGGLIGQANLATFEAATVTGDVVGETSVGGVVGNLSGTWDETGKISFSGQVSGSSNVGGLFGYASVASIDAAFARGQVRGTTHVGGLTGYSTFVDYNSTYASAGVYGDENVGGLVGYADETTINASYATGGVSGVDHVGGLAGYYKNYEIRASYATGRVKGSSHVSGLIGSSEDATNVSYWDVNTSGHTTQPDTPSDPRWEPGQQWYGTGQTTSALQSPTDYTGIFADWNLDFDNDSNLDNPWRFGSASEYPVLAVDTDDTEGATWEEFGHQVRSGPTLSISNSAGRSTLTWTAVDVSHWDPAPTVSYSIVRSDSTSLHTGATGLETLTYTDNSVTADDSYSYQVTAHVGLAEAAHSAVVGVPDTTPPTVESFASDRNHPTKDPFTVTIRFSEPVSDLELSEIRVANGSVSVLTGSEATYSIRVTPNAGLEGQVTVTIPAGVAEDSLSNRNVAGTETFEVDTRAPRLLATGGATVNGDSLRLTFNEALATTLTTGTAFQLRGESTHSVTAVSTRGSRAQLTVDPPVAAGESGLELDYTPPPTEALADTVGNEVESFTNQSVSNETVQGRDPGLIFNRTSVTVREGGSATYEISLATRPSVPVTVTISGESGDVSLNMTRLLFAQDDWDLPATVTVDAAEDDDSVTDPVVTLTHEAAGGDYDGITGEVRVSVTDNDGGGGGGGGGGAVNYSPVVEREIPAQTLDAGETLTLDIRLSFYDRDQRALDYTVVSADPLVATAETDMREQTLTIQGVGRGRSTLTVTAADRRDETASQTFDVTVLGPALMAYVPRASDPVLEGFLRVVNRAGEDAEIAIEATDDAGTTANEVTLEIGAGETVHVNSTDLEEGNADKGLAEGVGSGEGDWRLVLDSEMDFDAFAYIRTQDGFLTAMHDWVPIEDRVHRVAIFNPGSNVNQVSRLRLINPRAEDAEVTIAATDDAGASPGTSVTFDVSAGQAVTLTASELESGTGLEGALGDGTGKWRLDLVANKPIVAMSLLSSPTGHLANLSTVPPEREDDRVHVVPLFPSASDMYGRQGFVRVVNTAEVASEVQIEAYDDSETVYDAVTLSLDASETVHFNSNDLELGNAAKGLAGSTGSGVGDWRLELSSETDIDVLAYIRTSDGFLTSMHDDVPVIGTEHTVATFNPGSNPNQVSGLRIVNPGAEEAEVTITGIDDTGASPGSVVTVTVPAGNSRTVWAAELESGGEGLTGALGDGAGKWRLSVAAEQPLLVMSLLSSPTGHLTNLSTAPASGVPVAAEESESP